MHKQPPCAWLFINPTSDTLALGNDKTIKFIVTDRDTSYYDEGYVKMITDNKEVKFAKKQVWVALNLRKRDLTTASRLPPVSLLSKVTGWKRSNTKQFDLKRRHCFTERNTVLHR